MKELRKRVLKLNIYNCFTGYYSITSIKEKIHDVYDGSCVLDTQEDAYIKKNVETNAYIAKLC